MARGKEEKLQNKLLDYLRSSKEIKKYGLQIGQGIQVPKDFTYIPYKNKFCLGGVQTDISLYKEVDENISNNLIYTTRVNNSKDKKIRIPYLVLELKTGSLTSDAIRARDLVARDIKNIFPHIPYLFIAENTNKKNETLFRQGKSFTNFYIKSTKFKEEDFKNIARLIVHHLSLMKNNGII